MNREMRKTIESAFYNYEKYEDMKSAKDGLGMAHVLDTLNRLYGKDFIKY